MAQRRHALAALPLPADYDRAAMLALGDGPATPYASPAPVTPPHDARPRPRPAPAPTTTVQRGLFDAYEE